MTTSSSSSTANRRCPRTAASREFTASSERPPHAGLELALEENVPDHPRGVGRDRVERKQADAGLLFAPLVAVEATEQLVAAADGEEGGAALKRLM